MYLAGLSLPLQADSLPTEFFVVSEAISDASPFWSHYILHVTPAGRDTLVRYIRIAPLSPVCAESVAVRGAAVKIPGVQPADLIPAYDICAVDAPGLNRNLQKRTHIAAIDDSVCFGIVASCGAKEVVVHLPFPELVKLENLRKKSPQTARWWDLQGSVVQRAFGSSPALYDIAEQDTQFDQEGESMIDAIRSGRFDKGLQNVCRSGSEVCQLPSFAGELARYAGSIGYKVSAPKLTLAAQYRFKHYAEPKYPPLAMQARIQSDVKFDLSVDPSTGSVREVNIVVGHPLFRDAVISAARQWQFEPDGLGTSGIVHAELSFQLRCPGPIN